MPWLGELEELNSSCLCWLLGYNFVSVTVKLNGGLKTVCLRR